MSGQSLSMLTFGAEGGTPRKLILAAMSSTGSVSRPPAYRKVHVVGFLAKRQAGHRSCDALPAFEAELSIQGGRVGVGALSHSG